MSAQYRRGTLTWLRAGAGVLGYILLRGRAVPPLARLGAAMTWPGPGGQEDPAGAAAAVTYFYSDLGTQAHRADRRVG